MNIFQQIERRSYLATDAQIIELAKAKLEANETIVGTEFTYLRILIAGTQEELGMKPRLRAARKAEPIDNEAAMRALEKVHAHYYKLVLEAVTTPDIEDKTTLKKAEKSRRALERNRRGNFARTNASLARAYIQAGGNISSLVVTSVTKAQLRTVVEAAKPPQPKEVVAERLVASVMDRIEALREESPPAAETAIQQLLVQLSALECGDKTTTSPKKSMQEGIPLRTPQGTFLPVPNVPTAVVDGKTVTVQ